MSETEKVNQIEDLRQKLFDTIDRLLDKKEPLDISRAKAVAEVATVLVDTAKAEVMHLQVVGGRHGSGFIKDGKPAPPAAIEHSKK